MRPAGWLSSHVGARPSLRGDEIEWVRNTAHCGRGEKGLKGVLGGLGFDQHKEKDKASPANRAQVLLPTNFPQLYGRGLRSPLSVISKGAVMFGHNFKFPLRWNLTKDVPPEEGELDPPSMAEALSPIIDSGIGTSIDSSSGQGLSPSSFYDLGSNPRLSPTSSWIQPKAQAISMDESSNAQDAADISSAAPHGFEEAMDK